MKCKFVQEAHDKMGDGYLLIVYNAVYTNRIIE